MVNRAARRAQIKERAKVVRLRRFKKRGPKPKPMTAPDDSGAPADDLPDDGFRLPTVPAAAEEGVAPIDAMFDTTDEEDT